MHFIRGSGSHGALLAAYGMCNEIELLEHANYRRIWSGDITYRIQTYARSVNAVDTFISCVCVCASWMHI